jgi:hypothetical protein
VGGGGGAAAPLVATALFAVCHGLNYKGLHDFEKRMIISKLLGGGGAAAPLVATALFAGCHGLNDKGLHDFEKRMIITGGDIFSGGPGEVPVGKSVSLQLSAACICMV